MNRPTLVTTIAILTATLGVPDLARAQNTELEAGKYYYIVNKRSGMCLDVKGGASANNTGVQQYPCNGTGAQRWHLGYGYQNTYQLKPNLSQTRCLDGWNTPAVIYDCDLNKAHQKWQITSTYLLSSHDADYYRLKSSNTQRSGCLDVKGGSQAAQAEVQRYACNNTDAQAWAFEDASSGTFAFIATADPQYGYWTGRQYTYQANETFYTIHRERVNKNRPNNNVLVIAGDLTMDSSGGGEYGDLFNRFMDSSWTVIDVRGNHDKKQRDDDERTFEEYSRVHKNKPANQLTLRRRYDPPGEPYRVYYYAHEFDTGSGGIGKMYFVSLGEHDANSKDFMTYFMSNRHDKNIPIVIVKHRISAAHEDPIITSDNSGLGPTLLNQLPVVGIIVGHQHCSHDGQKIDNNGNFSTGYPCSSSSSMKDLAITNKWGRKIKVLNAAAAFGGVYWRAEIKKVGTSFEMVADKRWAAGLCYTGGTYTGQGVCPHGNWP